jgi:hypothetical protein
MFREQEGTRQRTMHAIMIGPRGVGKTSLLASLYDQFQVVIGPANLALSARGTTGAVLQQYRTDLRRFARGIDRDHGIDATKGIETHYIELGTRNVATPQLLLAFTDIPGEVISDQGSNPELRNRYGEALELSAVIFVAIDSPALMEKNGALNDEINMPDLVSGFVRDAAREKSDLLVVLVPLKCEKYMADRARREELITKVNRAYGPLASQLSTLPSTRCGVVLTPVQTVGSMHFSRFEGPENLEVFRLRDLNAEYAPLDTDQPLRWMLRFVVNGYQNRKKTFFDHMYDWWKDADVTFTNALRTFGAGCKIGEGFDILLNHKYLDVP